MEKLLKTIQNIIITLTGVIIALMLLIVFCLDRFILIFLPHVKGETFQNVLKDLKLTIPMTYRVLFMIFLYLTYKAFFMLMDAIL